MFAAVTLVIAMLTSFASFFIGQALLRSTHEAATLGQPNVLRAVLATALYVALSGLFAFGLGAILRQHGGRDDHGLRPAVPAAAAGQGAAEHLVRRRGAVAAGRRASRTLSPTPNASPAHLFSAWGEFAVFGGYTAILLIAGALLFRKPRRLTAETDEGECHAQEPFRPPSFGAAVLAGALALTGCAASAANTSAATTARRRTSATAPATAGGNAHIMVYSINSDGPDLRAIVTGAIGDYGPAVTVYPDGKVDPSHTHDLELKLTHGSFRLSIADLDKKFVEVYQPRADLPAHLLGLHDRHRDRRPIVPGSGTGAYRGISGRFHLTITADEVEKKPCQPVGCVPLAGLVLPGPGRVSVG